MRLSGVLFHCTTRSTTEPSSIAFHVLVTWVYWHAWIVPVLVRANTFFKALVGSAYSVLTQGYSSTVGSFTGVIVIVI